jgi:hypothetical protein
MTVTVTLANKTSVTFEPLDGEFYIDWEVSANGDLTVYKRYPAAEFHGCHPRPYQSFAKGEWREIGYEC